MAEGLINRPVSLSNRGDWPADCRETINLEKTMQKEAWNPVNPKPTNTMKTPLITEDQTLIGATSRFGHAIPVYDDGIGPLFIHRDSMGISGIVRAKTWEDAYSICEDEFFPTADDAGEELQRIDAMPEGADKDHEQACWDESYGHRPNGKGGPTPDKDCGLYARELSGESLDLLTPELLASLEITLQIEDNE